MKTALFALILASTLQAQTPITFPKDGGVLDVTAFGVKGNDNGDDTLCGINERNYNRQPVTLWVRKTQQGYTRETTKLPRVYLSHLLSKMPGSHSF